MDELVEGQPFSGTFIGSHIYYYSAIGYYNYLERFPSYTHNLKCANCGKEHTYPVEVNDGSDYFRIVTYCPDCKLAYENHLLLCQCRDSRGFKGQDFHQDKDGSVTCINCHLKADGIQDLLFELVG